MLEHKTFHHGNLKNEMIEQGVRLIRLEGVSHISLKKVAEKCGVSSPSTYRHFKNKQDLIDALFLAVSEIFSQYITVEKEILSSKDRILEMGVNFVYFSKEYPYYYEFLFQSPHTIPVTIENNDINLLDPQNGFNLFKDEVSSYLVQCQIEGSLMQHVFHLWSYISGFAMIASGKNSPFSKKVMIREQIENMLSIYTKGSLK